MPILQFAPFSSVVSPAFWHKLTELKIDVLKLSDASIPVTGTYTIGKSIKDRETGEEVVMPCSFGVGNESFTSYEESIRTGESERTSTGHAKNEIPVVGTFKNFNTVEDFKNSDKNALFNEEADKIWNEIHTTKSTSSLTRFVLLTFADLKKYKYFYWFGFPAFVNKPSWEIGEEGWSDSGASFTHEQLVAVDAQTNNRPFFLLKRTPNGVVSGNVEDYAQFYSGVPVSERTIGFIDPSAQRTNPGWPLRNLLAYLHALYPQDFEGAAKVSILRWRGVSGSWLGNVYIPSGAAATTKRLSTVGWERNPAGKLGARVADLGPMMDPLRLAAQAVDLNLKLMRWRILPQLDLEKVKETKCLLLGAGTLGCYVARGLMAWGVHTITFVDSARVSFSNPVRQPLFEFEDCLDGGKPKAECAAERMKKIYPGINATGHSLSIPMPGHPVPNTPTALAQARADVEKIEGLIKDHDAVFLLMDSRESRWLPSLIAAKLGKIVINSALGFDTFLVMRHGVRASQVKPEAKRLGCYYCNDVVAPSDSLTDRTLDQMCTVTRPGLAPIAAATAVEMLVSVIQHPEGVHAPPPPPNLDLLATSSFTDQEGGCVLGVVPHQIRGFLAQFRNLQLIGSGYERCTACSEVVLQTYEKEGFDMLLKAFNEDRYLEKLSGLDKLAEEGEAALEAVDWDEEGEGGDDF